MVGGAHSTSLAQFTTVEWALPTVLRGYRFSRFFNKLWSPISFGTRPIRIWENLQARLLLNFSAIPFVNHPA